MEEDVWKNIRKIMKEQGLRQYMVAERMGVTRQSISTMQKSSPTVRSLVRIAAALNVQVRDFFNSKRC